VIPRHSAHLKDMAITMRVGQIANMTAQGAMGMQTANVSILVEFGIMVEMFVLAKRKPARIRDHTTTGMDHRASMTAPAVMATRSASAAR
jgi:hypothetical protein